MRQKGFTLIELLVVIAIIGMLSSIVLASLNTARAKARDAKRLADFHNMSLALQMYYQENGTYPVTPNTPPYSGGVGGTHNLDFNTVAQALVNAKLLPSVPHDPLESAGYPYMIFDYGSSIGPIIVTYLESIEPTTVPPYNSCRPFTNNWCSSTIPSTFYCVCHPY